MLILPLAAPSALSQNPAGTYVVLPPGWKESLSSQGRLTTGAILGPAGEKIRFPPYGSEVPTAAEVHKRDPKATFVDAFLAARPVAAALTRDGTLTVTFGRRRPDDHGSHVEMSFDTKVATARETAVALGILLTRLDARKRDAFYDDKPLTGPDAPAPRRAVPGDPFEGEVSLPEGYAFRKAPAEGYRIGSFESPEGPSFSLWRTFLIDPGPWTPPRPGDGTWQETTKLLDGWLTVRGDAKGTLKAGFDRLPPKPRAALGVVAVAESSTPQTALAAIFAALTYAPPKA